MKPRPTIAEELAALQSEFSEIKKMHMTMSIRMDRVAKHINRLKRAETARLRAEKTECGITPAPGLENAAESK